MSNVVTDSAHNFEPIRGDGESLHWRTHNPVAVVPRVAHFAPSASPLSQTSDTKTWPTAQRTDSVPVTR
jgi:hypothetical protein